MSEKDIKTKPQTTTKSVKNAPKSVEHSAKQAVKDIKTVARDTLVKNAIDKQLDTRQSEQPQRAEVRLSANRQIGTWCLPSLLQRLRALKMIRPSM